MPKSKVKSPLVRFGPAIFISIGLLSAAAILFLGIGGPLAERRLEGDTILADAARKFKASDADRDEVEQARALPALRSGVRAIEAAPKPLHPRSATPTYPIDFKAPDAPKRVELDPPPDDGPVPSQPGTDPTLTDTLTLVAPGNVSAAPYPAGMAVYIFWDAGALPDGAKAPDDVGYFVYRLEAPAEGKSADFSMARPLNPDPISAAEYEDGTAEADKSYIYTVAQATKQQVEAGRARGQGEFFLSAMPEASAPVSLPAPPAAEWHWIKSAEVKGLDSGKFVSDFRIRRWISLPRSAAEGGGVSWLRLTLTIDKLKPDKAIGGNYDARDLLGGGADDAAETTYKLSVERFAAKRFAVERDAKAALGPLAKKSLDFSTGLTYVDYTKNEGGKLVVSEQGGPWIHRPVSEVKLPPEPPLPPFPTRP